MLHPILLQISSILSTMNKLWGKTSYHNKNQFLRIPLWWIFSSLKTVRIYPKMGELRTVVIFSPYTLLQPSILLPKTPEMFKGLKQNDFYCCASIFSQKQGLHAWSLQRLWLEHACSFPAIMLRIFVIPVTKNWIKTYQIDWMCT